MTQSPEFLKGKRLGEAVIRMAKFSVEWSEVVKFLNEAGASNLLHRAREMYDRNSPTAQLKTGGA